MRRTALHARLLAIANSIAAAVALGWANPATASAGPSAPVVEISGFGYGHGRGMGQWGAYGYASKYGWSYKQILAHYYGGATLSSLPHPEPDVTVRLNELYRHNVIASSASGGALVASWSGGQLAAPAFEVVGSGHSEQVYSSTGCTGPWRLVASAPGAVTIASAQTNAGPSPAPASVASSEVQACLGGYGARTYQGQLVVRPGGETDNVVGLEDYIEGVVPSESPVSWATSGGEAALEAQAVAARSYVLAVLASSGTVCDTTACQVYLGLPDQYGQTADAAVLATAGQVLRCQAGTACGPAGSIVLAEYSASTGGWTAGGAFPPVQDLGDAVAANPVHSWQVSLPAADVEAKFASIGSLISVQVTQRNGLGQWGGRAEAVVVKGTASSVQLTGDQFAADLDLRSDWFDVRVAGQATPPPTTPPPTTPPPTTPPPTTAPPATRPSRTTTTTTPTTAPSSTTTSTTAPGSTTASTASSPTTTTGLPGAATTTSPPLPTFGSDDGYWVATRAGSVEAFGGAKLYGSAAGTKLAGQVVAMAATADYGGYWLAAQDGAVLAFGDAAWYGSADRMRPRQKVIAMAATPDRRGYWLVTKGGAIYSFGDARNYGSLARAQPKATISGIAPTPDGDGYWLVARNGGIYAFGDAQFYGSLAGARLRHPIVALVPTTDDHGYFLLASDGGVFAFGDAGFLGSLPSRGIRAEAVSVASSYDGGGYYVLVATGRVYGFGDATLMAGRRVAALRRPVGAVAIAAHRPAV